MQVQFDCIDTTDGEQDASPPVLFCTEDGVLGRTAATVSGHRGDSRMHGDLPNRVPHMHVARVLHKSWRRLRNCSDVGSVCTAARSRCWLSWPLPNLSSGFSRLAHCSVAGKNSGGRGAALELEVVYREEASAMLGFDVDAVSGQDIAVVTDQECFVYLRRSL